MSVTVVEQVSLESGFERLQRLNVPDALRKPVPKERRPKQPRSPRVNDCSPFLPLTAETG